MSDALARLAATVLARRGADPASSHTARLFAKGPEKCAEKFGEEAIEAIIEAVRGDDSARLVDEAADALYHLLVMLAVRDVGLDAVIAELARRERVSGVVEKAARAGAPEIGRAVSEAELAACFSLRRRAFVDEQGVAPELEIDGLDGLCHHYAARFAGEVVGTARVRVLDGGIAKIQRVAVSSALRGRGVGARLMRGILADLDEDAGIAAAVLDSQVSAVGFYEALGFVAEGPEFLDAGLPHRRMRRLPPRDRRRG